jgi:hypothetical protein
VARIDKNHGIEPCRMRLCDAPETGFSQFKRSIIMDDEVQTRI